MIPTDLTLEDERILLRPLSMGDEKLFMDFALNEPELWAYSLANASGKTGMTNYCEKALLQAKAGKEFPFLVLDKRTNEVAGTTRFYDMNWEQATLQLGYTWYGKKFQGTGLNQHCKHLLLQYAFETLGIQRVEFRADADNAKSIAAMKALGCTPEGHLRSNCYRPDGTRRASIVLSILHEEWPAISHKIKQHPKY